MKNQLKKAEPPYVDVKCIKITKNLSDAGKFYKVADAKSSLQCYLDQPDTPSSDDPKHIFAHVFGINNIRELLYRMDLYNEQVTRDKTGKKIKGVRMYHGLDCRTDSDFGLPHDKLFRDLIIMPVLENGHDLYPMLDKLIDNDIILSGSRPCPPQCKELYFFNYEEI